MLPLWVALCGRYRGRLCTRMYGNFPTMFPTIEAVTWTTVCLERVGRPSLPGRLRVSGLPGNKATRKNPLRLRVRSPLDALGK